MFCLFTNWTDWQTCIYQPLFLLFNFICKPHWETRIYQTLLFYSIYKPETRGILSILRYEGKLNTTNRWAFSRSPGRIKSREYRKFPTILLTFYLLACHPYIIIIRWVRRSETSLHFCCLGFINTRIQKGANLLKKLKHHYTLALDCWDDPYFTNMHTFHRCS